MPPPLAARGLTCASGAAAGATCIGNPVRERVESPERVRQRKRTSQDLRADPVRLELALARDGELDQHRPDRREQEQAELGQPDARRRRCPGLPRT